MRLTLPLLALATAGILVGCSSTAAEPPVAEPGPLSSSAAPQGGGGTAGAGDLPSCEDVQSAVGTLLDGLAFDPDLSASNTAEESYPQRVCVYSTGDGATQLGVTLAAIPFQQTELDAYSALPNALQDPRLEPLGGVLQTFAAGDGDDGHLDSALYLFDTTVSITIQGITAGGSTLDTLPQLTVPAAVDAAFAVRALV